MKIQKEIEMKKLLFVVLLMCSTASAEYTEEQYKEDIWDCMNVVLTLRRTPIIANSPAEYTELIDMVRNYKEEVFRGCLQTKLYNQSFELLNSEELE